MKLFIDMEFTGLHQNTTPISIGIVADNANTFYAEFSDYDETQINPWLKENVIDRLLFMPPPKGQDEHYQASRSPQNPAGQNLYKDYTLSLRGSREDIKIELIQWLLQFERIDFWGDCLSYDWVLLNDLIADYQTGLPMLPDNVNYIPFDLCTLLKVNNIDPDINREEYSGLFSSNKHNALHDAQVIRACYQKLLLG